MLPFYCEKKKIDIIRSVYLNCTVKRRSYCTMEHKRLVHFILFFVSIFVVAVLDQKNHQNAKLLKKQQKFYLKLEKSIFSLGIVDRYRFTKFVFFSVVDRKLFLEESRMFELFFKRVPLELTVKSSVDQVSE